MLTTVTDELTFKLMTFVVGLLHFLSPGCVNEDCFTRWMFVGYC